MPPRRMLLPDVRQRRPIQTEQLSMHPTEVLGHRAEVGGSRSRTAACRISRSNTGSICSSYLRSFAQDLRHKHKVYAKLTPHIFFSEDRIKISAASYDVVTPRP
jgi:hypothetical protein